MTEPYYLNDYVVDDGLRDRFRWSRFSNPAFVTVGLLLFIVVVLGSSRGPLPETRREAVSVAHHIRGQAHHIGVAVEARHERAGSVRLSPQERK